MGGAEIELPPAARWLLGGILAVYLLGLFGLSVYASGKVETEEDYAVAGRKLPLFLTWSTLMATWFGAAAIGGAAEAARKEGLRGVILDPFGCSGTLILAGLFFAGPLWRMKLTTVGDFFRRVYGPKSEVLTSLIQVPSYFGWIAAQYVALAEIQVAYFGIPRAWGVVIAAVVTLSYTLTGGMWSVTLTETAQIVIALVGLVVLADATFSTFGNGSVFAGIDRLLIETHPDHLTLLPAAGTAALMAWIGTWATGLFGNIPGQDLQQRIFSAKSERTAIWACLLAGVVYLIFGLIPVSLGLISQKLVPGNFEGDILSRLMTQFLSPTMQILFVMSLVSILLPTATSAVLAPATILSHNLLAQLRVLRGNGLLLDRISVVLMTIGSLIIAFTDQSVMTLLDGSLSIPLVALFVPLVMGLWFRPRGEMSAILASLLGLVAWTIPIAFETLIAPMPAANSATGQPYADYHAFLAQAWGPDRVGSLVSSLVIGMNMISADILGTMASFGGYFLGQWIHRHQPAREPAARVPPPEPVHHSPLKSESTQEPK